MEPPLTVTLWPRERGQRQDGGGARILRPAEEEAARREPGAKGHAGEGPPGESGCRRGHGTGRGPVSAARIAAGQGRASGRRRPLGLEAGARIWAPHHRRCPHWPRYGSSIHALIFARGAPGPKPTVGLKCTFWGFFSLAGGNCGSEWRCGRVTDWQSTTYDKCVHWRRWR